MSHVVKVKKKHILKENKEIPFFTFQSSFIGKKIDKRPRIVKRFWKNNKMKNVSCQLSRLNHETKIIKSAIKSGAINRLTEHSSPETGQTLYNNLIYDKNRTSYQWKTAGLFIIAEGKTDSQNLKTTGSSFCK